MIIVGENVLEIIVIFGFPFVQLFEPGLPDGLYLSLHPISAENHVSSVLLLSIKETDKLIGLQLMQLPSSVLERKL